MDMKQNIFFFMLLMFGYYVNAQNDTLRFVNGSVFIGNIQNGVGVLYTINGDVYKGTIFNRKKGEACTKYQKNGCRYYGELKNGQYFGHGRLEWPSGTIVISDFKNGLPNGEGYIYKKKGCVYHGEIKNGLPHGIGGNYCRNGYFSEGEFIDGKLSNGIINGTPFVDGRYMSDKFKVGDYKLDVNQKYRELMEHLTDFPGEILTASESKFSIEEL